MDNTKQLASNGQDQQDSKPVKSSASPASVRPKRADFKSTIHIGSNGSRISEDMVKSKITESEPKLRRRQLRENGWTQAVVFDREGYNTAFKTFRDGNKQAANTSRLNMISEAFDLGDGPITQNSRLVRSLQSLMPLFSGVNDRKTIDAMRKIVRVVHGSVGERYEEKAATAPRTPRARKAGSKAEAAVH